MPVATILILSACILLFLVAGGLMLARPKRKRAQQRVLVVDDAPVIQLMMGKMLGDLGCLHDSAVNGREALLLLDTQKYDLIFMDCQMPVLDGFTATQAIRELPGNTDKKPVIVALSADTSENDKARCIAAGMNDCLAKPFHFEQVETVLRKWV